MDTYLKILDSEETHKAMAFDGVNRETVKIPVLDKEFKIRSSRSSSCAMYLEVVPLFQQRQRVLDPCICMAVEPVRLDDLQPPRPSADGVKFFGRQ